MHVFRNMTEWVIAEDACGAATELLKFWKEQDPTVEKEDMDLVFEQVPDDDPLTVKMEDGPCVTKKAREWVQEKGRGVFATTEY